MTQNYNIHISNLISPRHNLSLTKETVPEKLETCAIQMDQIASIYRRVADLLRTKQMQILSAEGSAEAGFFTVDEIDAGRLKQAGAVVDHSTNTPGLDYTYPFYIDPGMDVALTKIKDMSQAITQNLVSPEPAKEEKMETKGPVNPPKEVIDELLQQFEKLNLSESGIECKASFSPKGEFQIDLSVPDSPSEDLQDIGFDRDQQIFSFKCAHCDLLHEASLSMVLQSLRLALAILSNLSRNGNSILHQSLRVVQNDLRLLEFLMKDDYGL